MDSLKNKDIFILAVHKEFSDLPDVGTSSSLIRARSDSEQSIFVDKSTPFQLLELRSLTPEGSIVQPLLENDVIQCTKDEEEEEKEAVF